MPTLQDNAIVKSDSFTHSDSKYLLSTYYVLATILSAGGTAEPSKSVSWWIQYGSWGVMGRHTVMAWMLGGHEWGGVGWGLCLSRKGEDNIWAKILVGSE